MFKITNRHILCLTALFIILFLSVSACQAANLGETIASWVVGGLITAVGGIIIWITSLFSTLGYMILTWVTDPGFIKVPVISNDFVRGVGLAITIPLANIVVFLSLVAIGVGTALRLNGYDARKLLLKLLGVALLINFVPLMCGVLIDITNILMNFFFSSGNSGLEYFKTQSNMSSATIKGLWGSAKGFADLTGGLLLATILLSVFNVLSAIVFVLFAILFLMRYVALWILVIIAPLMFAFMVLPATNGWWESWSKKFLNWCFVGTIAAFYLYLSQQMIALIAQGNLINSSGPDTKDLGIVEYLLAAFVPVAFLYFGFFETLNGGAMGSGAVINMAKGQARRIGSGSKRIAGRAVAGGAKKVGKGAVKSGAVGFATNKMASVKGPSWGAEQKGFGGWAKRSAADLLGAPANTIGAIGTAAANKRDEFVDESKKKAEKANPRGRVRMFEEASRGISGIRNVTDASNIMVAGLTDSDKEGRKLMQEKMRSLSQKQVAEMSQNLIKRDDKKGLQALYGSVAGRFTPEDLGITDPKINERLLKSIKEDNVEQLNGEMFELAKDPAEQKKRNKFLDEQFFPNINADQRILLKEKFKNFEDAQNKHFDRNSQLPAGNSKEIEKIVEESKDNKTLKEIIGNLPASANLLNTKAKTLEKIMNSNDETEQLIISEIEKAARNDHEKYVELLTKVSGFKDKDSINKAIGSTYEQAGVLEKILEKDIDPGIIVKLGEANKMFAPALKDIIDKHPEKVRARTQKWIKSSPGAVNMGLTESKAQKVVIVNGGNSPTPPPGGGSGPGSQGGSATGSSAGSGSASSSQISGAKRQPPRKSAAEMAHDLRTRGKSQEEEK